jgi:hypothetical protein
MHYAISSAIRTSHCPTSQALKAKGIATLVVPRMLQGTQWTLPSIKCIKRLRACILTAIWSTTKALRCTEIALGVLSDPTKVDPWGAKISRAFMNIKRLVSKNESRKSLFIENLLKIRSSDNTKVQGPAHTFLKFLGILDLRLDIDARDAQGIHGSIWISDELYAKVNLLNDSKATVRKQITIWIGRALIKTLRERCERNEEGVFTANGRKDMEHITDDVDRGATLANFS